MAVVKQLMKRYTLIVQWRDQIRPGRRHPLRNGEEMVPRVTEEVTPSATGARPMFKGVDETVTLNITESA
jgi:hypothetical protein